MATAILERPITIAAKSKHLLPLDGLRGLAILMVFFYHYGAGGIHSSSRLIRAVSTVFGFGWSGVDLFFVLSGFLITGILYDTQYKEGYYQKFYIRRTLRIFPIYYLFAAICLVILPFAIWQRGHLFFLAYLGYPAALIWPMLVQFPVRLTHLWSLSIEEQFYFLWPWLIKRLRTQARILKLCGIVALMALLSRIALAHHDGWNYAFILCRMDALAVGASLAMLKRADFKLPAWRIFTLASAAVVLMCVLRHTVDHGDYWISTFGFSLIAIAYGGLLSLSLGPLSGVFSNRILRVFGKYSYGLYLYHFPLTSILEKTKPAFTHLPLSALVYVTACLGVNLLVAMLSFHAIEQPILKLKKRFSY